MSKKIISVIGNPNCGKTTLFNALTGSRQRVGNWAGVTVDKKVGNYTHNGQDVEIVDLPGIYSITPSAASGEDERIAREYILSGESEVVINIVDASNLERNLFLTTQLIEMGVPMLVCVNMIDVAKQHNIELELHELEHRLGCPVVGIVASNGKGVDELKNRVNEFFANPIVPAKNFTFDERIEAAAAKISAILADAGVKNPNWYATQCLEEAPGIEKVLGIDMTAITEIVTPLKAEFQDGLDIAIANGRYSWIAEVAKSVIHRTGEVSETLTDRIDRVVLHPFWGLPIFLFSMYVLFLFTQNFGGAFIDFFDITVGAIFVDGLGSLLDSMGAPEILTVFLANGLGAGLQTVATFIPVVFFLFFFLAVMEESGYMARAAFIMDKFMRKIGLPGKAFVPLLVGFGCTVPAVMACRTMDRANDRILTVMMSPFMSCGARLPVYVLFATAFFPHNGQNLVFGLYLIGIAAAALTAFLLKRSAFPGEAAAFVMEVPPYHIPTLRNVMTRTMARVKDFVTRAGQVIVIIVACLSFFNSMGTDGSFGNDDSEKSILSSVGRTIVPVLEPMGVQNENWPAAVGIFTGIFAKEAVVGTLNSLYATVSATDGTSEEPEVSEEAVEEEGSAIAAAFGEAIDVTIENLAGLPAALLDPLGIGVGDLSDQEAAAEAQEVDMGTINTIKTLFGSASAAFAYLLLVLLYLPCCAAIAAIYREVGKRWAIFACAWTTVLGYSAATIFYRTVNFAADPTYATISIAACCALLYGMYRWMKTFAGQDKDQGPKVIPIIPVK